MLDLQPVTTKDWRNILLADPCSYCGAPSQHVDHIEPRQAGGKDEQTNLTGACQRCNGSKGGDTLLTFLSGQPVGHARTNAYKRAIRPHHTPRLTPIQHHRSRISNARSDWLYREYRFRKAYERKWGKPAPPPLPLPKHLQLPEDKAA